MHSVRKSPSLRLRSGQALTLTRQGRSTRSWSRYTWGTMDRIAMLKEILAANPVDSFARYGLAIEYSNAGDFETSMAEFATLFKNTPDYTPGYLMAAQTLVKASRLDDAKKMLVDGIASAKKTGNGHALSEMEAMLEELG